MSRNRNYFAHTDIPDNEHPIMSLTMWLVVAVGIAALVMLGVAFGA